MKVLFIKQPGGVMHPASDIESEKLNKFKTGELYEMELKNSRNPQFHKKVFTFFNFCFEHWSADQEFLSESEQFNVFRAQLTCMAGYYHSLVTIAGDIRIEAKSISFGSMSQEEFEELYTALINAASKHIFGGADKETEDKLLSFFF